ncbi:MAG: response regulator transcription factor [Oscillospiraceae bacterium]|nr:response regulator transcription factor [Oscillospiraceae bacterium]
MMKILLGGDGVKILIVEDETVLRKALAKGFQKHGYTIDVAEDGEQALDMYFDNQYNLVVLDLNLPKIDGLEVLTEIRKENKEIPVLILSARSEVSDKIMGLDMGANDYLAKPFHFDELEARARALLRRNFKTADTIISNGDIQLDTALKKVLCNDTEISLTKKEYGIFEYLMLNKGRVIGINELIESIWEDADMFSNSIKVHINSMRKKLPDGIIKNAKGQGYYVE